MGVKILRSSFVTWAHVATWSKEYVDLRLNMWLPIISHPSVKFDRDRSRESEFITFFLCHVTLYGHVINKLCDLMDNSPVLKPTTLSSLVAIGIEELRYHIFHLSQDNLITWSKRQKTQWVKALYYTPPPFQVEIYRFLLVTWLHVATWS